MPALVISESPFDVFSRRWLHELPTPNFAELLLPPWHPWGPQRCRPCPAVMPELKEQHLQALQQYQSLKDVQAMASADVSVKVSEHQVSYVVTVPGLQKEEIRVQIEEHPEGKRVLVLRGERKAGGVVGQFVRKFPLPKNAGGAEEIEASVDNGTLLVKVPRKVTERTEKEAEVVGSLEKAEPGEESAQSVEESAQPEEESAQSVEESAHPVEEFERPDEENDREGEERLKKLKGKEKVVGEVHVAERGVPGPQEDGYVESDEEE